MSDFNTTAGFLEELEGRLPLAEDLKPAPLDDASLSRIHQRLSQAIADALRYFQNRKPGHGVSKQNAPYEGECGLAAMYLRLAFQSSSLDLPTELVSELPSFPSSISRCLEVPPLVVHPSWLSPVGSSSGHALLTILLYLHFPEGRARYADMRDDPYRWRRAMENLEAHVRVALDDDDEEVLWGGGAEVLYGRAGLLWGLLNLNASIQRLNERLERDEVAKEQLVARIGLDGIPNLIKIVGPHVIRQLVNVILKAGRIGAARYRQEMGPLDLPLIWQWHDKYYLGAIHGVAGILTVLLQVPRDLLADDVGELLFQCSIKLLSLVTVEGDLPSSIPIRSKRRPHLVQICHGAPGALLLIATLKSLHPDVLADRSTADFLRHTEQKLTEKVWETGWLSKGMPLCHGVTGNAWPWLLLASAQASGEHDRALQDKEFSYALSFLVASIQLTPAGAVKSVEDYRGIYRLPDHPDSLFCGLAGAVCAWAEACAIISDRVRRQGERQVADRFRDAAGFPGLGGVGPKGVF